MINKYGGYCYKCYAYVKPEEGFIVKIKSLVSNKTVSRVVHRDCEAHKKVIH